MSDADMQQVVAVPGGNDELDGRHKKAEGLDPMQQQLCDCSCCAKHCNWTIGCMQDWGLYLTQELLRFVAGAHAWM